MTARLCYPDLVVCLLESGSVQRSSASGKEFCQIIELDDFSTAFHQICDRTAGATAAIKAGIPTVAILTSQTAEHMRSIGCCHCIKDYTELVALIPKEELSK